MSYILEALRKADAERERGAVPDLHAQLLPGGPADDEPEARRLPAWRWPALVAVLLLGVGAAAWLWLGDSAPPVAALQPNPDKAGQAIAPRPSPPNAPAQVAAAGPPPKPARSEAGRGDAVASSQTAPRAEKLPPAPPRQLESTALRSALPAPGPTALAKSAQAVQPAPPVRVPTLNELPDELRSQVPPLSIGGSVYSPQADRRMVVVNGQVFQEGASLAPELQLQQIRPKSAVFSIRGQRFELPL